MISNMKREVVRLCAHRLVAVSLSVLAGAATMCAQNGSADLLPGNLVVSRSVYDNNPDNVTVGATLPPGCTTGCGVATNDGTYPYVWNNDLADGSFGITSKIR